MRFSKGWLLMMAGCIGISLAAGTAAASMSDNPPEVGRKIREMGNGYSPQLIRGTVELYAPLLAAAPKDGVKVSADQAYGPHERHRLDVFEPEKKNGLLPVLIMVHGGGFVRGDKKDVQNIGYYFARNGILTITMNYRYAPEIQWPKGAEDVAAAIGWVREKAASLGADPNRIFLMGASAGAMHVSSYVFFEDFQIPGGDGVAGAILLSGPCYDTSNLGDPDAAYYGKDKTAHAKMSTIANVDGRKIPLFVAIGELDMPTVVKQNLTLVNALYERDKALPLFQVLPGHNHISMTNHFNTRDESAGKAILEFINSPR